MAGAVMTGIFGILSSFDGSVATAVLGIIYYEIVRIAEDSGVWWAGYLLGIPKQPIYRIDTDVITAFTAEEV
jgi:hypothetical protein